MSYVKVNSKYKKKDGRYYWSQSTYEDNFYLKTKVFTDHSVIKIGQQELKDNIYTIKSSEGCEY